MHTPTQRHPAAHSAHNAVPECLEKAPATTSGSPLRPSLKTRRAGNWFSADSHHHVARERGARTAPVTASYLVCGPFIPTHSQGRLCPDHLLFLAHRMRINRHPWRLGKHPRAQARRRQRRLPD